MVSKADISAWENEWKGRTFWSCGSSNGRGVTILFHPSLDFSLINVRQNTEGRILTIQINLDNTPIQLVNVYAPNNSAERVQFFEILWNYSCAGLPTIIGGDFNCVADLHLDKWGGNPQLLKPGAQALHSFTDNFNNDWVCTAVMIILIMLTCIVTSTNKGERSLGLTNEARSEVDSTDFIFQRPFCLSGPNATSYPVIFQIKVW